MILSGIPVGSPRVFAGSRGNVLPRVNHFEVKLMGTPMGAVQTLVGDRGRCDSIPRDSTGNRADTVPGMMP